MATSTGTTRRQAQHDAAQAEARGHQAERDAVSKRHNELSATVAELEEGRATIASELRRAQEEAVLDPAKASSVKDIRATLVRHDEELLNTRELRDGAQRKLQELGRIHSAAAQRHQKAVVALQREPCEEALKALDASLRGVERAWRTAAGEALKLEQRGDVWASSLLRELITRIGRPDIAPNGYHELALPALELPD